MNNKISLSFALIVVILSMLACSVSVNGNLVGEAIRGSGNVVEESRSLGNVSGVELSMQGTLYITMGTSQSFRVEAEDNLLEYVQTDVRGGRLVIDNPQRVNLLNTEPINFYLTLQELDTVEISSSGDVEVQGDIQSDSFAITISSSGSLSLGELDCSSLRVEISSSGDVIISDLLADTASVRITSSGNIDILAGQVPRQDITISSSGEYNARDLASEQAEVTLTSSGKVTLRVSDRLRGRLSSSGDVYYIGNPDVNVNTSSSGRVIQIDE